MDKKALVVISAIENNVKKIKYKCSVEECSEHAINSHLLQKNGVLNAISENGHLIQLRTKHIFSYEKDSYYEFKSVGINNAMSYPLFCSFHDNKIFQSIESDFIDFSSLKTQQLFSYRSLLAELYKKRVAIERTKRILNANTLSLSFEAKLEFSEFLKGSKLGEQDLLSFNAFLDEYILSEASLNYTFVTYKYDLIKVCASAIFSPLDLINNSFLDLLNQEKPLDSVFINIVPHQDNLYVILGYKNDCDDKWIKEYLKSWDNLNMNQLKFKISDLLMTKIETWAISPSIFKNIPKDIKLKMSEYWDENHNNFDNSRKFNFNIFN